MCLIVVALKCCQQLLGYVLDMFDKIIHVFVRFYVREV